MLTLSCGQQACRCERIRVRVPCPVWSSTPLGVTLMSYKKDSINMLPRTVIRSNRTGGPIRQRTAEQPRGGEGPHRFLAARMSPLHGKGRVLADSPTRVGRRAGHEVADGTRCARVRWNA